ncbi:hypothetical protein MUP77_19860 [Candidatus Bathyarchaeota archaeon]|nr:hypothetical protein [Candidatus Bathyarchaeota archaeon]
MISVQKFGNVRWAYAYYIKANLLRVTTESGDSLYIIRPDGTGLKKVTSSNTRSQHYEVKVEMMKEKKMTPVI